MNNSTTFLSELTMTCTQLKIYVHSFIPTVYEIMHVEMTDLIYMIDFYICSQPFSWQEFLFLPHLCSWCWWTNKTNMFHNNKNKYWSPIDTLESNDGNFISYTWSPLIASRVSPMRAIIYDRQMKSFFHYLEGIFCEGPSYMTVKWNLFSTTSYSHVNTWELYRGMLKAWY